MRKSTKKEEAAKQPLYENNNKANLLGYIRSVSINDLPDGRKAAHLNVVTQENWNDEKGEAQKRNTYHKVDLIPSDKKTVKALEEVAKKLEGENPKFTAVRVKGKLITREREVDGATIYSGVISADSIELDAKKLDKEARNAVELKGNIAKIDILDGFAAISIATKYYVPGESQNYKGETKPYTEKTTFVRGVVNEGHRPELFKALSDGTIGVGDLVSTRGQMRNDIFKDKNGNMQYNIKVDFNKVEIVAKKGEKQTEAEQAKAEVKTEAKTEKQPAKKAVAKRKKGMTI